MNRFISCRIWAFSPGMMAGLVGLLLTVMAGCGPDLSTPESTLQYAQEQADLENWQNLYRTLHPEYRETVDKRVQHLLVTVQDMLPEEEREPVTRLMTRTSDDRFAVLMEGLTQSPKYSEFIAAYVNAELETRTRDSKQAVVTLRSQTDLPFETVELRPHEGDWLVYRLELDRPRLLR